ncbi:MAG: zf-TFIIB domain-containing protein, partial [Deltaproteobacteria bacterium]|nr:zf-TFIIB domain-containing protein [Deltaproteobacteria bacterium]
MPRICPRCQLDLKQQVNRGVTLDFCEKCHGIWFDANEIDQVSGKEGMTEWLRNAAHACPQPVCPWCSHPQTRHGAVCEQCGKAVGALCPVCHVWMPTFDVRGTQMDFCVRCSGLWLDPGEFEKLSEGGGPEKPAGGGPARRAPSPRPPQAQPQGQGAPPPPAQAGAPQPPPAQAR